MGSDFPCREAKLIPVDTPAEQLETGLCLLKRGASGALVVQVAGAGLGLLSHFAVAKVIGKSEYGVYALALSWVSVLVVVAQ